MESKKTAMFSPPPARKCGSSARRPLRSETSRSQSNAHVSGVNGAVSVEGLRRETPNIVCEIFREDIAYRSQARNFLWEFFD